MKESRWYVLDYKDCTESRWYVLDKMLDRTSHDSANLCYSQLYQDGHINFWMEFEWFRATDVTRFAAKCGRKAAGISINILDLFSRADA